MPCNIQSDPVQNSNSNENPNNTNLNLIPNNESSITINNTRKFYRTKYDVGEINFMCQIRVGDLDSMGKYSTNIFL